MKSLLKASILANLLLATTACWFARRAWVAESPFAGLAVNAEDARMEVRAAASPSSSPVESAPAAPAPFYWSQLESADYRTYIANLRNIGCPEQTIRDIITADVDVGIYAPRREHLTKKKAAQADGSLPAVLARYSLEAEFRELNHEEAAVIAALLGQQPSAARATANPAPALTAHIKSQVERDLERAVSMPLVLQTLQPGTIDLSETQIQAIDELRQGFQQEMNGANQETNDPAYRQRWQAAQRKADEMLAAMLGRNFSLNYQMQAQAQAAERK